MVIEARHRNRIFPVPGVTAKKLASNAWELTVPRTPEAQRLFGPDLRGLDGAVFVLDGKESEPTLISGEGPDGMKVSVWILG